MYRELFCLALLTVLVALSSGCPNRCLCFRTTVRCMFLQLETIPKVPAATTILDLRFNRISEIPPGIFKHVKNLNTLLLNNNEIRKIENGAFEGLSELKYLYLYKNNIREVGSKAFHGLDGLEQLYIHFNKIEDLERATFTKLPSLERLFLHNNSLKRLPAGVFNGLTSLRRLRLDSNALICDCQLMWLSAMLKSNGGFTQAAVTCEYPSEVKGKSLLSVTNDDFHCRKPELTVEPSDVEVSFGKTAYFTCRAEGEPEPEIIWLHNNEEISNNVNSRGRHSVLDDGTLMIEDTKDTDQGVYECVARNVAGEAKATAVELKYHGQPARAQILRRPKDMTAYAGDTATLECRASGHPAPTFVWSKNNSPVENDPRFVQIGFGDLMIKDIRYEDRGIYRCTVSNDLGPAEVGSATVEVLEKAISRIDRLSADSFPTVQRIATVPPQFVEKPASQNTFVGESVYFTCRAEGQPTPTLRWNKDGSPIPSISRYFVTPDGGTVRISQVSESDRGVFTCIAESTIGRNEASADLSVGSLAPPVLKKAPVDAQAPLGTSVEFRCIVEGHPPPSVEWRKNNIEVRPGHKYTITNDRSLIVHRVERSDEGIYACLAQNVAGITQAYARLVTLGRSHNVVDNRRLNRTVGNAIRDVNRAINNTYRELHDRSIPKTASDLLRLTRLPERHAVQLTRAAEIFERTLEILHRDLIRGQKYNISHERLEYDEILTSSQLAILGELSGCIGHRRVAICDDMCYHHKFRTFDGTCNNLRNPMWGASLVPLKRLFPAFYENGFNTPRGWESNRLYNGHRLPSARTLSVEVISAREITLDERYTHMLMQWGQFLDHDIDLSPLAASNSQFSDGRYCNETCENQAPCFPIPIAPGDRRITRHRCMGVTRSSAICGSGMTSVFFDKAYHREQVNLITSFIDSSNVYGSSEAAIRNLRDFSTNRGLLRTGIVMPSGKPLLPPNQGEEVDCQVDPNTNHVPCFHAGDVRSNEQLGLTSMHTLFMREHNRLATELGHHNPDWDGDRVFHESRKILGAMAQHITYKHWLPKILGDVGMKKLGDYKGYDPTIDPSILNAFSTGAFRFGHSLINPIIYRLNESFQPISEGNIPLHKAFFAPFRIVEEGGIDPVLRGMIGRAAKKLLPGQLLNSELTEKLFKLAHEVALDLGALNVQRGRDHGLRVYNDYREYCGLPKARTFDELRNEIQDHRIRRKLQQQYGHPDNIDLWLGGLLEDVVPGAKIGPTFMCLIVEQFKRLRGGDRFWYESPGVFTPAQLTEIKQANLGRLICDNSDGITEVQQDVFLLAKYPSQFEKCDSEKIPKVDLRLWTHCCHDCARSGEFYAITGHFRRGKRSLDYSYPHDKPQADAPPQNTLTSPPADVATERPPTNDTRHHHHHHDEERNGEHYDPVSHMHSMMDAVDSRIEGVEDIVGHLQKNIFKLNKKVRRLGRRLHTSHKEATDCLDERKYPRKHGAKWREHDCRICECKNGQLECTTETCQLPTCDYPRKVPGQCCPVCP